MADKHLADGEAAFFIVSSTPDVCAVGSAVVPFDSFQKLDNKRNYVETVYAHGVATLHVGSVIAGTQGNAGSGVVSGTALNMGDNVILTGSPTVRIEGQPAARHDSDVAMNNYNCFGKLITNKKSAQNIITDYQNPCGQSPQTSVFLESLKSQKAWHKSGREFFWLGDGIDAADGFLKKLHKSNDEAFQSILIDKKKAFAPVVNSPLQFLYGLERGKQDFVESTLIGAGLLANWGMQQQAYMASNELTLDTMMLLENIQLNNVCIASIAEDAKKALNTATSIAKYAKDNAWDFIANQWGEFKDAPLEKQFEIYTHWSLEIGTIFSPTKVGKVGSVADEALNLGRLVDKASDSTKIDNLEEITQTAVTQNEATKTLPILNQSEIVSDSAKLNDATDGVFIQGLDAKSPDVATNVADEAKNVVKVPETENSSLRVCNAVGEPVDIVNGDYLQQLRVLHIEGVLPLQLNRLYRSTYQQQGLFGDKWNDEWSQHFILEPLKVRFVNAEGVILDYPTFGDQLQGINAYEGQYSVSGERSGVIHLFNRQTQQTLHFGYHHGNKRRLSQISDRFGNHVDFIYNEQHQLIELLHTDGYALKLLRDTLGRLVNVTLHQSVSNGVTQTTGISETEETIESVTPLVHCEYDENNRLINCNSQQFEHLYHRYNVQGHMIAWGDTDKTHVHIDYDARGRVVSMTTESGHYNDRFEYNDELRCNRYIDAEGGISTYWYNSDKLVTKIQDPLGRETRQTWHNHQLTEIQDAMGRITQSRFNQYGELIDYLSPSGLRWQYRYNHLGQCYQITQPDKSIWHFIYGKHGEMCTAIDPQGQRTQYSYDEIGRLLQQVSPTGQQYDYRYQAQQVSVSDPLGHRSRLKQDNLGRIWSIEDALGHQTHYQHSQDHLRQTGSITAIHHPDGAVQTFEYNSERLVNAKTDGEGNTERYHFGAFDLLERLERADGSQLTFTYDRLLRLIGVTNALGETYRYERDLAGQVIREIDFTGRVQTYQYDAIGRRIRTDYPDGAYITFEYNAQDALIHKTHYQTEPNGQTTHCTDEILYEYDTLGRLTKATNRDAEVTYQYDEQGRLLSESINGRESSYQYDETGTRIVGMLRDGVNISMAYDARGDLSFWQVNHHNPLALLYSARGQELARTSQSGFSQLSQYTEVGLLAHRSAGKLTQFTEQQRTQLHQHQQAQSQLIGTEVTRSWHYNLAHQLVGIEDPVYTNEWYRLNANQQITEIKRTGALSGQESFTYDVNLNLIAQHIQPTAITGQNIDSIKIHNIQLTGRTIKNGDNWFKYDNQGRLIEKRVVENGFRPCTYFYHWNALNQLVRYSTSQGDEWHYQYDAFGRRIRKLQVIHNNQPVEKRPWPSSHSQPKIGFEYYYLGDQLIEEAPIYADGTVAFEHSTHWLYAPNQLTPTARYQQGELNYVITDQLGTPTELIAEDGTGRWRVKHNLWGSILKQYSANDEDFCNLRFPGQYLDNESGLHYNRHRYYDPNTAQYLTPDPIGLAGGFNPYGYVHNPTGWIDPLGLACCHFAKNPKQAHAMIKAQWDYEMSPAEMRELHKTIDNIKLNRPVVDKDGTTFSNSSKYGANNQRLDTGSGPYTEWTVNTPSTNKRGRRRIVFDQKTKRAYYSHDHYESFIEIDLSGWR